MSLSLIFLIHGLIHGLIIATWASRKLARLVTGSRLLASNPKVTASAFVGNQLGGHNNSSAQRDRTLGLYKERFCYTDLNVKFVTGFSFHSEANPSVTLPSDALRDAPSTHASTRRGIFR